jgi:hypothetical protein
MDGRCEEVRETRKLSGGWCLLWLPSGHGSLRESWRSVTSWYSIVEYPRPPWSPSSHSLFWTYSLNSFNVLYAGADHGETGMKYINVSRVRK